MSQDQVHRPARDWLSLGPASRLVGVDPDTLRRWADEGRVVAFATPGGHRRFDRRSLERLTTARRGSDRRPLSILGATSGRLSRAYRRSYADARIRAAETGAEPVMGAVDREAFRADGRRLVESLLAYLDATGEADRVRAEAEAGALADDLARRLAASGTSLTDSVALFVAARRPFLAELASLAGRRALDPSALASLYEAAAALLDRLLLRLIGTHQAAAIAAPAPAHAAAAGPVLA